MKTFVCLALVMCVVAVYATGYGNQGSSNRRSGGYSSGNSNGGYGSQSNRNGYGGTSNGGYGGQSNRGGFGGSSRGGYGSQSSSGYGQSNRGSFGGRSNGGYGGQSNRGGYGGNSNSGYGDQNGDIQYNLKYEINLPENEHGASADWMVEQDNNNAHYNLQQTHPYGARSNVYFSMQNDH